MADADTELFSEIYGPYAQATCAIFDRANGGFCLSFDQGPNYDFESWLGDSKTVFKFAAGTVFQLRVMRAADRSLQFQALQLAESNDAENMLAGPVPVCGSEDCIEVIPCPDPTKTVMICTGGVPRCISPN